jgi:hypothetical protein
MTKVNADCLASLPLARKRTRPYLLLTLIRYGLILRCACFMTKCRINSCIDCSPQRFPSTLSKASLILIPPIRERSGSTYVNASNG